MDRPGQRGQVVNVFDMVFFIQYGLVQMGYGPALRDVESEQLRQLRGRLFSNRVPPGPKTGQLFSILIKRQVSVHHAGNTDGCDFSDRLSELL